MRESPLQNIDGFGLGFDFDLQTRRRLVDQIDGFVGQKAVGDIAIRKFRRGDDGGVGDAHAVMGFVALAQAAQNRDRVDDRRLSHQNALKAPLQGGVFFDMAAVFVERRRADATQLAARERGL